MADRPKGTWVRLQASAYMDPAILKITSGAELVFYRSLMFSALTGSSGLIPAVNVLMLVRGVSKHRRSIVRQLLDHGLWTACGGTVDGSEQADAYLITNFLKYNPEAAWEENTAGQRRNGGGSRAGRGPSKARRSDVDETPRARGNDTNDTDGGSNRTPSGSVRLEPAQAAPRSADGAAQPAPTDEVGLAADEAQASIRETIAKTRAKWRNDPVPPVDRIAEHRDPEADAAFMAKLGERMAAIADGAADE